MSEPIFSLFQQLVLEEMFLKLPPVNSGTCLNGRFFKQPFLEPEALDP